MRKPKNNYERKIYKETCIASYEQENADLVNSFPSVSEVQRVLGYKASNISRAVKFNKLSYGYYWKY